MLFQRGLKREVAFFVFHLADVQECEINSTASDSIVRLFSPDVTYVPFSSLSANVLAFFSSVYCVVTVGVSLCKPLGRCTGFFFLCVNCLYTPVGPIFLFTVNFISHSYLKKMLMLLSEVTYDLQTQRQYQYTVA